MEASVTRSAVGPELPPVEHTIADIAARAAARFGGATAIRHKIAEGDWRDVSYEEVNSVVREIALGLIDLGIEPGDRVCILADTSPEWTYASFAVWAAGGIVVPIYPTNSPKECEWVAGNSGAVVAICENAAQIAKIEEVRDRLGELRQVVGFSEGEITLEQLRGRGRDRETAELTRRAETTRLEDPCIFIYTSGTTGPPKGCVLTHLNCAALGPMVEELGFIGDDEVSYLFLPLAHVFAQTVQIGSFEVGATIVYLGGDTKAVIGELSETRPTYFPSVPRIFEKLYTLVTTQAEPGQIERAVKVGLQVRELEAAGEEVPEELLAAYGQADEALFSKVRAIFGGEVRQAVSGAAPIAPEILSFFLASGVPVLEGYGLTETCGVGTVNTLDDQKVGTVGRPLPAIEIRVADDGEVLMRGPNVFREYWRNPEATAEAKDSDGWFHTGDLGSLDEDGFLSITGRKKDIIITAGGKNLTPANIENDLKRSRWVSQAIMHGDRRPFPTALITLDEEEILPWAAEQGLPATIAELATEDRVIELIQVELDRANSNYAQVEQIKRFFILEQDLSQEAGELTPTLKVKRNVINERYAERFEALYG
ncbi:MAG: AMP-dependent synthetase/ligase [Solirubrobacterales bacterium]